MAKIGDHVDTIYGIGTVISGKRVMIHGTKDRIISYEDKKIRVIKSVIGTRLRIEEQMISTHKKFLRAQKVEAKESKETKPKEEVGEGAVIKPKKSKSKPSSKKISDAKIFSATLTELRR